MMPMRRRRMGRPGLLGTMARTAVVAGTASAVVGGVRNRQAGKAEATAQEQAAVQQSQAEADSMQAQLNQLQSQKAVPAAGGGDMVAELTKLADLKAAGVLSDEEFATAKAKLLA